MTMRPYAMNLSAKTLTMGLLLASSTAVAQDVAPVMPVAPTPAPPVEAVVPVAPPPVVRTLPNSNDTVAPQAAAEAAEERTEREPPRASVVAAPARRPAVTTSPVSSTEAPFATEMAEQAAPIISGPTTINDIAPIVPTDEPAGAATQADIVPADEGRDNDWVIGTGIAAALGLAGIAFLATRRRRRSGDVVTKAAPTAFVEKPRDIARPAERSMASGPASPSFAAGSVDPLSSMPRHDIPVAATGIQRPLGMADVTDPLFAHRPVQTPVADPMFASKVEVPPITDPMFAKHPDYAGQGANPKPQSKSWTERKRELEPAE